MTLASRKIPILEGINDVPSTQGQSNHPNASLLCKQFNDLIDNELTSLSNNLTTVTTGLNTANTNISNLTTELSTVNTNVTNLTNEISSLSIPTTSTIRQAISVTGQGTYNPTTGVIDIPLQTQEVRLNNSNSFTRSQRVATVALTDGATINVDASLSNVFSLTLAGNRTLANPTNLGAGQTLIFKIRQDGTGNRTLTWGNAYRFPNGTAPTLSTQANRLDVISCVSDGTNLYCNFVGGYTV